MSTITYHTGMQILHVEVFPSQRVTVAQGLVVNGVEDSHPPAVLPGAPNMST